MFPYLIIELFLPHTAVFDKNADIIPEAFVAGTVVFEQLIQLVCDFFRDIAVHFLHIAIAQRPFPALAEKACRLYG